MLFSLQQPTPPFLSILRVVLTASLLAALKDFKSVYLNYVVSAHGHARFY